MSGDSMKVANARRDAYGHVRVVFADGRVVLFEYNGGGFGESTAIGRILIRENGDNLVVFNGPRQHPVNHTPFGFDHATLELEEIIDYLTAAIDYCKVGAHGGPLLEVWREVSKAYSVIEEIKNGKWRMPA